MVGLNESESFGRLIEELTPLPGIRPHRESSMLVVKEQRRAIRTLEGWAISVLLEAGAIRECEEHGWMQDRTDPHTRERAFDVARSDPPAGASPQAASVAIAEALDSIGDPVRNALPSDTG
jgi:hypothetical protein